MDWHNYTYQSDFAKKYVAKGIEEGRKEGRKEGIELGHRELLRDQLEQRFGELPADLGNKLEEADTTTLRAWGRRLLTATSLADIFASDPR